MRRWSSRAVAAAGISALMCLISLASPAHAAPATWESKALRLADAHKDSRGKGITVAVLDSGVEEKHPALAGRVRTGPDFVKDGLRPGDPRWGAHGTAMASSVLHVAPEAEILSVRVINDKPEGEGSSMRAGPDPVVEGIDYALAHGADVISLSLGGTSIGSSFEETALAALGRAASAGVPVLSAAGNSGDVLNEVEYPAAYPAAIAVAAAGKDGKRAGFSQVHTYNAVAAPGVGITTAKNTGGFEKSRGTSPATALTAGVVALMLSRNTDLTPAQVRSILCTTAKHPEGGYDPRLGSGRIDAAAAVRAAVGPPADQTVPARYTGKKHLGAPNGIPQRQHAPLDVPGLIIGLLSLGTGVLMVLGAILIPRRARRRAVAAPAGPPGVSGRPI